MFFVFISAVEILVFYQVGAVKCPLEVQLYLQTRSQDETMDLSKLVENMSKYMVICEHELPFLYVVGTVWLGQQFWAFYTIWTSIKAIHHKYKDMSPLLKELSRNRYTKEAKRQAREGKREHKQVSERDQRHKKEVEKRPGHPEALRRWHLIRDVVRAAIALETAGVYKHRHADFSALSSPSTD